MTTITKLSLVSVLALVIATPALAQEADWSQKGDYYAPGATVVQQPTTAQTKQAEEGDFYAAMKGDQASAQRAAAIESCTQRANAEYGPSGDINWRRFNHDTYAACMTNKGEAE